jgi:glutathione S-transferase
MIEAKLTAVVTVAAIVYTVVLSGRVGAMRARTGVAAPATTGDPLFERAFRVHMNTTEQLVLFLPALWLAQAALGDLWAAIAGAVWLVGRMLYATSYARDPAKRGPGMMLTLGATSALLLMALYGIVRGFTG